MRVKVNKFNRVEVFLDAHDVCFYCENKLCCPLLKALRGEVVILRYEAITVQNCKFFKGKEERNEQN